MTQRRCSWTRSLTSTISNTTIRYAFYLSFRGYRLGAWAFISPSILCFCCERRCTKPPAIECVNFSSKYSTYYHASSYRVLYSCPLISNRCSITRSICSLSYTPPLPPLLLRVEEVWLPLLVELRLRSSPTQAIAWALSIHLAWSMLMCCFPACHSVKCLDFYIYYWLFFYINYFCIFVPLSRRGAKGNGLHSSLGKI